MVTEDRTNRANQIGGKRYRNLVGRKDRTTWKKKRLQPEGCVSGYRTLGGGVGEETAVFAKGGNRLYSMKVPRGNWIGWEHGLGDSFKVSRLHRRVIPVHGRKITRKKKGLIEKSDKMAVSFFHESDYQVQGKGGRGDRKPTFRGASTWSIVRYNVVEKEREKRIQRGKLRLDEYFLGGFPLPGGGGGRMGGKDGRSSKDVWSKIGTHSVAKGATKGRRRRHTE